MPMGTPLRTPGPVRTKVLELRQRGLSGIAIAKVLGVSHQAVYVHLRELRKAGHLKEKTS